MHIIYWHKKRLSLCFKIHILRYNICTHKYILLQQNVMHNDKNFLLTAKILKLVTKIKLQLQGLDQSDFPCKDPFKHDNTHTYIHTHTHKFYLFPYHPSHSSDWSCVIILFPTETFKQSACGNYETLVFLVTKVHRKENEWNKLHAISLHVQDSIKTKYKNASSIICIKCKLTSVQEVRTNSANDPFK